MSRSQHDDLLNDSAYTLVDVPTDRGETKSQEAVRHHLVPSKAFDWWRWTVVCAIFIGGLGWLLDGSLYDENGANVSRCDSMMRDGRWLGNLTHSHAFWQTSGCFPTHYRSADILDCFQGQKVVFAGDSTARAVFERFVARIGIELPAIPRHSDVSLKTPDGGITLETLWDPYLNSSLWDYSRKETEKGAMLFLKAGYWDLKNSGDQALQRWSGEVKKLADYVSQNGVQNLATEYMVMSFLHPVLPHLLSPSRHAITPAGVEDFNDAIIENFAPNGLRQNAPENAVTSSMQLNNVLLPFSVLKMYSEAAELTSDGLHYDAHVQDAELDVILNRVCNPKLKQTPPFRTTCCAKCPLIGWKQATWMAILTLVGPTVWLLVRVTSHLSPEHTSQSFRISRNSPAASFVILGLAVVACYLSDRSTLFVKERKEFSLTSFCACLVAFAIAGWATATKGKDDSFLNRDQTEEWKGWMQLVILLYHYTGASSVPGVYQAVRVLVGSYLFMTGYGHFSYFYKTADYSLHRFLSVLLRLNLLPLLVVPAMESSYLAYYFSPLVSLWFIVVWLTMGVFSHWNGRPHLLALKMVLFAALFWWAVHKQEIIDSAVYLFAAVTGCKRFDIKDFKFRLILDFLATWAGMLCSWAYLKGASLAQLSQYCVQISPSAKRIIALVGFSLAMFGYALFSYSVPNKFEYNRYHPVVSLPPILAFIWLRNSSANLRQTHSTFFRFIGRCSLETFILQFHVWMAMDTKGILVLVPNPAVNTFVTTIIFIWASDVVAKATTTAVGWMTGGRSDVRRQCVVLLAFVLFLVFWNRVPVNIS
ncbi:Cas1p-domain-containing protein [Gonapodya prolifera JEL478]|uniref:Cas1p-domain-containing protein n=1 Tax=Gonapodya prolifera (strain JEL478) TaxID=1344416 RepID=A0A139AXN5_GONPJ|nr:Cas1p-domain-containing protein [Gonapodya prolifera JEL478]|eukprot:KXS21479.1 Cas1p-domain-containing protein [Gonapodya prolifera JEL478]